MNWLNDNPAGGSTCGMNMEMRNIRSPISSNLVSIAPFLPCVEAMRIIPPLLVIALAACSAQPPVGADRSIAPATVGETVTVRLSNFAFDPEHIGLRAGAPVRLRLVNESDGAHNFSAPAFLAGSSFPLGSRAPVGGEIEV